MARKLKPCGTDAAYQRHYARGEPIDEACKAAHSAKVRPGAKARQRALEQLAREYPRRFLELLDEYRKAAAR